MLPSMVKNKEYTVHICLTESMKEAEVRAAFCVCVAGLGGCCNHVAATIYALEDFVRKGLREEAAKTCTSKLQAWNQPRKKNVTPLRVLDIALIKSEYGSKKRLRRQPFFDPRPVHQQAPNLEDVGMLRDALEAEHQRQLSSDMSGFVKLYGSSCWRTLLQKWWQ